jgi:hypothetical protein
LSHSVSPFFVLGIFKIGSLKLFAQGWPRTMILLISASWVAEIIGMSHWRPAVIISWNTFSSFTFFLLSSWNPLITNNMLWLQSHNVLCSFYFCNLLSLLFMNYFCYSVFKFTYFFLWPFHSTVSQSIKFLLGFG